MLYAALLNRSPDPGGLTAYTGAIQQHGLRWAITSMLASGEFQSPARPDLPRGLRGGQQSRFPGV